MRLNRFLFLSILALFGFRAEETTLPKLHFPINPGQQNFLAGTMGELRRGHFHGGIDVKTLGQTGLPIYAAEDGYISRVSVSPGGYGRRLNIKHDNGYITVYAHLQKFAPDLEEFTLDKQYEIESFRLDYFPKKHEFPVKKGEIIAFSGNSGYSAAPHLHFEVRDKYNQQINPLEFGFIEVQDSTPPIFQRIRFVPKGPNSKINGLLNSKEFSVKFKNLKEGYYLKDTVNLEGPFGIEFKGYDKMSGNWNRTGIQGYRLLVDGKETFNAKINYLPVLLTRYINLHIDYETLVRRNKWFHKVFKDQGNKLPFYSSETGSGMVNFNDSKNHTITLLLEDAKGNETKCEIQAKNVLTKAKQAIDVPIHTEFEQKLEKKRIGHFLKIKASGNYETEILSVYSGSLTIKQKPNFIESDAYVYLWDLGEMIPDSARLGEKILSFNVKDQIPPGIEHSYFSSNLQIDFLRKSLYDTFFLELISDSSSIQIGPYVEPLRSPIKVARTFSDTSFGRNKTFAYLNYGKENSFVGGYWKDNKLTFSTKNLGRFVFLPDTIPPKIKYLGNKWNRLRFKVQDDLSGLKKIEAHLNGEWVLMEFDAKNSKLVSRFKNQNKAIKGEFELILEDMAGNKEKFNKIY